MKKLCSVPTATASGLKKYICSSFKVEDEECAKFELGYYEPGHGTRGKKRCLTDDDDLKEMKKLFQKKEILLWCYDPSISKKRTKEIVTQDLLPPNLKVDQGL